MDERNRDDDFRYSLPAKIELDFSAAVTDWEKGKIDRLWARDASLWTNQDESKWMGWLISWSVSRRT